MSLGGWSERLGSQADPHREVAHQSIESMDSSWTARVLSLEEGKRIVHWKTKNIERFVRRYAGLHTSKNRLRHSWLREWLSGHNQRWQDVMLWCLQNSPMRALKVLDVTLGFKQWQPPRYMVQDSLQFLSRHFLHAVAKPDPFAINTIWDMTGKFVKITPGKKTRAFAMSQEVVQLLLKRCYDDQVLLLHRTLQRNHADLRNDTLLHFLDRFIDMRRLSLSMHLLRRITSVARYYGGASLDNIFPKDKIQSACVKMLRMRWFSGRLYIVQSKILTEMLEMGIKPNTQMCNVILLNMIEGGDFDTAWKTYDLAKQSNRFVGDANTYDILLKGARMSGNAGVFKNIYDEVMENPALLGNLRLFGALLHAIGSFSGDNEYSAMLDLYRQYLDLRPLRELGMCRMDPAAPLDASVDGKWPDKYILGQMILAYNKQQQSPHDLVERYNIYHDLIEQGHPLISPLAGDDFVANSFLMAFSKRPTTLRYCTVVLQHMFSKPRNRNGAAYAAPTVRTWSILIAGYILHKQSTAAEKVLTMMQARGLEPDVVTWNTLIGGYAAMQNIEGAFGMMKRMESQGYKPDPYTLRALARLWDREKLLSMLKEGLEEIPRSEDNSLMVKYTKTEGQESRNSAMVESMTEGWEADGFDERSKKVARYIINFRQTY